MNKQYAFGCFYKYVACTDTTHGSHFADKMINKGCFNKLQYLQLLTNTGNKMWHLSELQNIGNGRFRVDKANCSNIININRVQCDTNEDRLAGLLLLKPSRRDAGMAAKCLLICRLRPTLYGQGNHSEFPRTVCCHCC